MHLKERKTPIIGDAAYGIRDWNQKLSKSDSIDRPLLHAYEVQFSHPYTKQLMKICAPLPPDMANLVKKITSFSTELLDENNLLTCSTEVSGSFSSNIRGFVPSDRLVLEEEDWTAMELPEEQPF